MASTRRGGLIVWRAFATGAISLILNGPASVCATDGRRDGEALRDRVSQSPSEPTPAHHFFCHTGYSQPDCDTQAKRLSDVLAGLDLARLGEWTWVLVQSRDWKPILRRVGRDPDSPAFTILDKRQTFLEEALFRPNVDRSRILLEKYRVPLDQLLYVAITHELGHAICHEVDELKAIAYANQLRNTGRVLCGQPVRPPQCRDTARDPANSGADTGTSMFHPHTLGMLDVARVHCDDSSAYSV